MKKEFKFKRLIPSLGMAFIILGIGLFSQCSKEDEVTPIPSQDVTGEYSINPAGWNFDKSHSGVNWKTAYVGDQAFLTGKFNSFDVTVDFDQQNLSTSSLSSWVVLSTANTGEPGRDAIGKCLNGSLGVEHNGDTLADGSKDPAGIVGSSDTAKFVSTSIIAFGSGYKAEGNLTFKGTTKPANVFFTYITEKDYSAAQDGTNVRAAFIGTMEFLAKTDYGVTSGSIADKITVNVNANFRKK